MASRSDGDEDVTPPSRFQLWSVGSRLFLLAARIGHELHQVCMSWSRRNSMTEPTDLFGRSSKPDQYSLFGEGESRLQAPRQSFAPDTRMIRRRLTNLLELARTAQSMPWSERDARMWQTVFPQMANWLPDEEAEQLRFEFAQEIERLRAA
jgi:hypothetical protein